MTTTQLEESAEEIVNTLESLDELKIGFEELINNFDSLYENIEEQNANVKSVDSIFGNLRNKVSEMSTYSETNQQVVESIIEAMQAYQNHINKIIDDTKVIHKLSASMLDISNN